MKSDDGAMRARTKDCYVCYDTKEALYQCRYDDLKDKVFSCGKYLMDVKTREWWHLDPYNQCDADCDRNYLVGFEPIWVSYYSVYWLVQLSSIPNSSSKAFEQC